MTMTAAPNAQRRLFAVAAALLAVWGVGLWLYNALFFRFAGFFDFRPVHTALALAIFHIAYAALALPAALFHRKFGFKLGVLAGLSVYALGAFFLYAAIVQHSVICLIGAAVVIGSCGAWLDTSLNPLAVDPSRPETAIKRLNLAHLCSGLGMYGAVAFVLAMLGNDFQLFTTVSSQAASRPYVLVGLGALIVAFLVEQITLPDYAAKAMVKGPGNAAGLRAESAALLRDKDYLLAAAALGAYCIVLTILWTASYQYHNHESPDHIGQWFEQGAFLLLLGRIAGNVLMRWVAPLRLLQWSSACGLVTIAFAALAGGLNGLWALVITSVFLAINYPTVLGAILGRNVGRIATAAGLTAIACGVSNALSSLITSLALDTFNVNPRLVVLAALPFQALILFYAIKSRANETVRS
jgi:FHS family L-fucose permease-like MFS transporter